MQPRITRRHAARALALITAFELIPSLPATAANEFPLAIKGYDPVAYFTVGKPTPGLAEFEYAWDERRYRFANAENRELFKADPVLSAGSSPPHVQPHRFACAGRRQPPARCG